MKKTLTTALGELSAYKKSVSQLKKISDDIRVTAKQAIACSRRGSARDEDLLIGKVEKLLVEAAALIKQKKDLQWEGFYSEAAEEYVEAKALLAALRHKALVFPKGVFITAEHIVGGICDATGELVRKAITDAFSEPISRLEEYNLTVREIVELLSAESLSGKFRAKYDDAERNLKRLEEIIYQLKLQGKK